ncbi:MAG: hypothetical protein AAF383_20835 [Cyanobacteria bacterium P01_A01_bin.83]
MLVQFFVASHIDEEIPPIDFLKSDRTQLRYSIFNPFHNSGVVDFGNSLNGTQRHTLTVHF